MNRQGLELQKKIILEDFNFLAVYKHMVLTNWTWRDSTTPPTPEEMREVASNNLQRVIEHFITTEESNWFLGSGGFVAEINTCSEGWVILNLRFEVASWNVFDSKTMEEMELFRAIYST